MYGTAVPEQLEALRQKLAIKNWWSSALKRAFIQFKIFLIKADRKRNEKNSNLKIEHEQHANDEYECI